MNYESFLVIHEQLGDSQYLQKDGAGKLETGSWLFSAKSGKGAMTFFTWKLTGSLLFCGKIMTFFALLADGTWLFFGPHEGVMTFFGHLCVQGHDFFYSKSRPRLSVNIDRPLKVFFKHFLLSSYFLSIADIFVYFQFSAYS